MRQNIFLIGPTGSGKSTVGRSLAKSLHYEFYDSDKVVEERCGTELAWIFDIEGEKGFRERESQIIDELTQKIGIVLATGAGVVLSQDNCRVLAARGVVVYLHTSVKKLTERMQNDKRRPLLQTTDLSATLSEMQEKREALYENIADHVFNTENRSVQSVADEIIKKL